MLKQHAKLVAQSLYTVDIAITIISFIIAHWIRASYLTNWDLIGIYPIERYLWLLLIIIPVWTILLHQGKAYLSYRTISFIEELMHLVRTVVIGSFLIGAFAFVLKLHYLSRLFIFTFMVVNLVFLVFVRFIIRSSSWIVRKRGYNYKNVIIVGTGDIARDIARRINNYGHWGLKVGGFVSEKNEGMDSVIDGYPVIGVLSQLEGIIKKSAVDEVIVAVKDIKLEQLEDTFLMLEDHGINARIVANIFPHVIAKMRVEDLETVPLLTFSTVPSSSVALAVKRILDVVVSLSLIILCAPLMLLTMVLIKTTSPGPVLFKQKRSGLQGRIFTLYKFRSMYIDAEAQKTELEKFNEMEGPVFKIKDDPRITSIGKFIRRSSIDELPQLWNVLMGDMSIVGPRPPIPEEVALYERWQRRRLSMRPGLTCLWQISGRNRIRDFNEWVKLDLQYIDTWSPALDMKIFFKTIPVVLFRKGAE